MAVTASKYIVASSIAALNTAIAAEIAASRYPVGNVIVSRTHGYPAKFDYAQRIDTGATAVTQYKVLEANSIADLGTQLTAEIAASRLPVGDPTVVSVGPDGTFKNRFYQATATAAS